ncbi:LysR family transcriptional regulator [Rhizobium ruizarguesonis]|uniref:LysR family transcriptional regulator n=1 Tax=Rhizobium ruizarguesonis TaxID=2081791 RepID=UPI0013C1A836|nr:LysR family transcriptional regulator [Rhizobium ruizarguesonis]NEJ02564.1 LysR family transcriptional regulator [Rhizobium ruizarguesonis]NEJ39692.1 LysR family transcriptional regulator [Rhizobium ruizarguesonis]
MELRQLSYFVAVAEELHFGRAAAKVRIAQPALSNHVQALERELGVQLFIRSTRRVELTRAGETFYERSVRILSEIDLSTEIVRSVAGKTARKISIGTVYPATIGVLPSFLARIARKYPDIRLHVESGTTDDIIRHIEAGRINLGFIRPVENIGSLRFFSIAHERYLLAVASGGPLSLRNEIDIEDLRSEKIISFSRQNLSYSERYFAEKFEAHDLTGNIAYSCYDTFSLVSLVSAGLGVGFVPEWTQDLPNRGFELRKVRGVDFKIGLGVAWNREDPTAGRDDIIDIARSLARPGR